ncbi:hypothetical protein FF2_029142 [Malus domestica]
MEKSTTAAILLLLYFFEFCPQLGVSSFANPSDDLDFNYLEFVCNATDLPLQEEYDYMLWEGARQGARW